MIGRRAAAIVRRGVC